jgi:zinc protease
MRHKAHTLAIARSWIPAFVGMTLFFCLCMINTAHAAVFYPTSFTLANGLQVVVVPNHLAPVVSQMVWYKVGSADEIPGKTGLAHYLEHLMFRGTDNVAPGEFSKMIAGQGGDDNAFTAFDYTAYFETVAADRLSMIMSLEADRMQHLRITPETATPELSVVLDERQQRTDNDPHGRFSEKTRNLLMPHHPYGTPVIGWKKEIEKLTVNDARQFYERHYAPNNAIVIISGDVTPDQVMRLAASIYGAVPKREIAARKPLPETTQPKKSTFTMVDVGVEQPQTQLEYVVPSYSTQKKDEAYAFETLAEALDSGEVGVLYRRLVIEKGVASGIGTNYDSDARGDAIFTIAATPHPGADSKKLETAMAEEITKLAQSGLDAKTVDDAKQRLKRSAIFARDSLMMPGYVFGMAVTTGHTVNDVESWPDRISSVSVDDVNAALRNLAANPKRLTASLLPDKHASASARDAAHPVMSTGVGIR